MSTIAQDAPSLRHVVAEVHEGGRSTREVAEAAIEIASESDNREAAIRGWQDEIQVYERSLWEEPKTEPRSGHNNGSGRYTKASRPDQGIFGRYVRTNDGSAHKLGELTAALCGQLEGEYHNRERHEAAGRKFFAMLKKELKAKGKDTVAELGAELVEGLREKCGYRE